MAKDDIGGVWRTIGGRKVFIKDGQDLASAMKESGKFKTAGGKDVPREAVVKERIQEDIDEFRKSANRYQKTLNRETNPESKRRTMEDRDDALKRVNEAKQKLIDYDNPKEYKGKLDETMGKHIDREQMALNNARAKYKEKEDTNYRDKITDVAKNSKEDNVTLDVETGKPVSFEKGYSVSFQQSSDAYSDEEYAEKVAECRDKCDGKVYAGKYGGDAEASFHTDNIDDAKELMYKYNQESIYDWQHETLIMNDKYDASKNQTNYKEEKTTSDYMNEKIRSGASKNKVKDDLPKRTEIKTQGTSNRKEVSENIQAHILDYYDSPQDFVEQMDNMNEPTMWRAGETLAKGGSYMIYYDEQREFLDSLKINPKGKEFSDDRVFQTYTSLVGRESAKLYDRLKKNAYKKYLKEHPGSDMSFSDFKDMSKGGK